MRHGSNTDFSAVIIPVNIIQMRSDAAEWCRTSPNESKPKQILCLIFKDLSYMAECSKTQVSGKPNFQQDAKRKGNAKKFLKEASPSEIIATIANKNCAILH